MDIDEPTVTAALTRTERRARETCRVMPATDQTGVRELLGGVQTGMVDANQLISTLASHPTDVSGGPFDGTVSLAVLTQLLQAIVDTWFAPEEVPRVALALRDLVRLTRLGGRCI